LGIVGDRTKPLSPIFAAIFKVKKVENESYVTLVSLCFIALSNLFSLMQNIQQFRSAAIERRKINLAIRALIDALEQIGD